MNVCMWSFPKFSGHFLNEHVTDGKRLTFSLILFDYNCNFITNLFCLYIFPNDESNLSLRETMIQN